MIVVYAGLFLALATSMAARNSTLDACEVCDCIEHFHAVICTGRGLEELPTGIPNDTVVL